MPRKKGTRKAPAKKKDAAEADTTKEEVTDDSLLTEGDTSISEVDTSVVESSQSQATEFDENALLNEETQEENAADNPDDIQEMQVVDEVDDENAHAQVDINDMEVVDEVGAPDDDESSKKKSPGDDDKKKSEADKKKDKDAKDKERDRLREKREKERKERREKEKEKREKEAKARREKEEKDKKEKADKDAKIAKLREYMEKRRELGEAEAQKKKEDDEKIIPFKPHSFPAFQPKSLIEKWEWHVKIFPIDAADIRSCVLDSVSKIAQETWFYIDKQNYGMGSFDLCVRNVNEMVAVIQKLLSAPFTYRFTTVEVTKRIHNKNEVAKIRAAYQRKTTADADEEDVEDVIANLPYSVVEERAMLLLDYMHTCFIQKIKGKEKNRSLYVKYLPDGTSKELLKVLFPVAISTDIITTRKGRRLGVLNVGSAGNVEPICKAYVTVHINGVNTITLEWRKDLADNGVMNKIPRGHLPWEIIPRTYEYPYEETMDVEEDEKVKFSKRRKDYELEERKKRGLVEEEPERNFTRERRAREDNQAAGQPDSAGGDRKFDRRRRETPSRRDRDRSDDRKVRDERPRGLLDQPPQEGGRGRFSDRQDRRDRPPRNDGLGQLGAAPGLLSSPVGRFPERGGRFGGDRGGRFGKRFDEKTGPFGDSGGGGGGGGNFGNQGKGFGNRGGRGGFGGNNPGRGGGGGFRNSGFNNMGNQGGGQGGGGGNQGGGFGNQGMQNMGNQGGFGNQNFNNQGGGWGGQGFQNQNNFGNQGNFNNQGGFGNQQGGFGNQQGGFGNNQNQTQQYQAQGYQTQQNYGNQGSYQTQGNYNQGNMNQGQTNNQAQNAYGQQTTNQYGNQQQQQQQTQQNTVQNTQQQQTQAQNTQQGYGDNSGGFWGSVDYSQYSQNYSTGQMDMNQSSYSQDTSGQQQQNWSTGQMGYTQGQTGAGSGVAADAAFANQGFYGTGTDMYGSYSTGMMGTQNQATGQNNQYGMTTAYNFASYPSNT